MFKELKKQAKLANGAIFSIDSEIIYELDDLDDKNLSKLNTARLILKDGMHRIFEIINDNGDMPSSDINLKQLIKHARKVEYNLSSYLVYDINRVEDLSTSDYTALHYSIVILGSAVKLLEKLQEGMEKRGLGKC